MNYGHKKLVYALAALAVLILVAIGAHAQSFRVSTGGAKGTYSAMFKEIQGECSSQLSLTELNSSGSMENINRLVGNEVNGAFVQADVLHYRNNTENLSNVKTLVALHPEEVHVVGLAFAKEQIVSDPGHCVLGKCFGAKSSQASYQTVADLSNTMVGAWGGSVITAQVIRLQSELGFKVVEFESEVAAKAALDSGGIQAIIAVGGSPLGFVKGLSKDYKLLSFPESVQSKIKGVYNPARVSYTNVTNGLGVQTVSTNALFVVWDYKKNPKVVESLAALRRCIFDSIGTLQETTGTHPKWKLVSDQQRTDVAARGKWTWYEFPLNATLTVVPSKKSK